MAGAEGEAYHAIVAHGNPLAVTLDGTHDSVHSVRDVIMRASNSLDDTGMVILLEVLAKVLQLRGDCPRGVLGTARLLWLPLSRQNHNGRWFREDFLQAYLRACAGLVRAACATCPEEARSERTRVEVALRGAYGVGESLPP